MSGKIIKLLGLMCLVMALAVGCGESNELAGPSSATSNDTNTQTNETSNEQTVEEPTPEPEPQPRIASLTAPGTASVAQGNQTTVDAIFQAGDNINGAINFAIDRSELLLIQNEFRVQMNVQPRNAIVNAGDILNVTVTITADNDAPIIPPTMIKLVAASVRGTVQSDIQFSTQAMAQMKPQNIFGLGPIGILAYLLSFSPGADAAKVDSVKGKKVVIFLETPQDENVRQGERIILKKNNKQVATLKVVKNRGLMADALVVQGKAVKGLKVQMPHQLKNQQAAKAKAKAAAAAKRKAAAQAKAKAAAKKKAMALAKARAAAKAKATATAKRKALAQAKAKAAAKKKAMAIAKARAAAKTKAAAAAKRKALAQAKAKAVAKKKAMALAKARAAKAKAKAAADAKRNAMAKAKARAIAKRRALAKAKKTKAKQELDPALLEPAANRKVASVEEDEDDDELEDDLDITDDDVDEAPVAAASSQQRSSVSQKDLRVRKPLSARKWHVSTEMLSNTGAVSDYQAFNLQVEYKVIPALAVGAIASIGSYESGAYLSNLNEAPEVSRNEYGVGATYNFSGDVMGSGVFVGAQFRMIQEDWQETNNFVGATSTSSAYSAILGYQYVYGMFSFRLGYQVQQVNMAEIADFDGFQYLRQPSDTYGVSSNAKLQLGIMF